MAESKATYSRITFVRHGQSIGNLEDRMQGLADFPLSETGRKQAKALARHWQENGNRFDVSITSPLSRAEETARILVQGLNIPSLEFEPLWVERDMGLRSGMTMSNIREKFIKPEFVNPYVAEDNSMESDWALYLRAGQALHKVLQRSPGSYLVVSHGAILHMTLYVILGIVPQPNSQGPYFKMDNTCVSSFRYYPDLHQWRADAICDQAHLNSKNY